MVKKKMTEQAQQAYVGGFLSKCAEAATDLEKQARVALIYKLLQALAKANQPTALGATKLQLQNVEAGPIGKTVAPAVSKLDAVLRKHRPEFPKGQAQQEAFGPLDQFIGK